MMTLDYKKNNGFILILTLLCALILSSVMMSTMFVSTKGQKVVKNFKESVQTLNAADAAIKKAKGSLNTWLTAQQIAAGTEVYFTSVLAGSTSSLVIPGDATDWSNLSMFGNTVKVTVYNTEGGVVSGGTDSDRIIVLEAEATSATRQRVKIQASIQAPNITNTAGGMPTLLHAALMCNDATSKKQTIRVDNGSILSGYNHALPAVFPSSTALYNATEDTTITSDSKVGAALINATKQKVDLNGTGTVKGVISGTGYTGSAAVQTLGTYAGCSDIFKFADQVSLLSDSLPNVQVLTASTIPVSTTLGTRASPMITILNGVTTTTKKKTTKSKVMLDSGVTGAGILILQGETETADSVLVAGKNFYYEGLIIVYGDDSAVMRFKQDETMYGAALILTGSDDVASTERLRIRNNARVAYSKTALDNANNAYGRALTAAITSPSDPRNTTITIGWHEEYGF
jgi:hypothetical protein